MDKLKVLNLYAGIGGNRKLWENVDVTAVELNPEVAKVYSRYFPQDELIVGDAHEFLLDNHDRYDFIWSSVPCQSHSKMARVNYKRYGLRKYPDMKLYQEIIYLTEFSNSLWVVENVDPYYDVLIPAQKIDRHLFWANFKIRHFYKKNIDNFIDAKFDDLKIWLGYHDFNDRIYLNGTHDYTQILRNCVHPQTGLHVLNCARNIIENKSTQLSFI